MDQAATRSRSFSSSSSRSKVSLGACGVLRTLEAVSSFRGITITIVYFKSHIIYIIVVNT